MRRREGSALSYLSWTSDGYTVKFRLGVMDIVKTAVEVGVFDDSWRIDRMLDWVGLMFQSYSPLLSDARAETSHDSGYCAASAVMSAPTPPAASRATASAPSRWRSRSLVSAPSPSCRTSPATALVVARELQVEALCAMPTAIRPMPAHRSSHVRRVWRLRGRTRASSTRRSRPQHEGVGRVGRARRRYLITSSARSSSDCGIDETESLRGLEVDHQLELRGLLDGQVSGFGAFDDPIHVVGCAAVEGPSDRHRMLRDRQLRRTLEHRQRSGAGA